MFTGIVLGQGIVEALAPATDAGSRRIAIRAQFAMPPVDIGGSVAVDGVCLTVVKRRGRLFEADLGPETLRLTTLGALRAGKTHGSTVHLEPALRVGDALGGHLVSGHVDGLGTVRSVKRVGDALSIKFAAPPMLMQHITPKGSITIDGVSLTVNTASARQFEVMLIPHTLEVTKLGSLTAGEKVNLETDLIAKHVLRLVAPYRK